MGKYMTTANTITGRYIRQIVSQVDTTPVYGAAFPMWVTATTATTADKWQKVFEFPNIPNFVAGSVVRLYYHVPTRKDSVSWNTWFLEPQISYNGGSAWASLGGAGFDGGGAIYGYTSIGVYRNTILIDPQQSTEFGVQVRILAIPYETGVNQGLGAYGTAIDTISGTAVLDATGINAQQHHTHIIVEELALVRGS